MSGRRIAAMVVNDYAYGLDKRGALESIVGTPPGAGSLLQDCVTCAWVHSRVGASLLAMVVNDYAYELDKRGALESFASRLAPTGIAFSVFPGIA
ncbi:MULTISPECIES: hypothetical protein [Pseudomonas]|uniref:hypothetical protein n=1 Tax=Pseudomonas sp. MIL9 TaxID=2807620 RepID=UPI00195270BA|nr:hypothetical protein [Pseudomonas sp. MIL9]MBM6447069.1 hypothetical protein [Pseudomonas sp. MIL9]